MKTVLPLLAEYLGTFLISLALLSSSNVLFVGVIFTVILYLILPVSGAAINPAISLLYYLKGSLGVREAILYSVIQVIAAVSSYYTYAYLA